MPAIKVSRFLFEFACAVAMAAGVAAAQSQVQQPYHVIARWKIGGNAGWDYLSADPVTHNLFVSNGAKVVAVDTSSGKIVGAIDGLQGSHGIAFDDMGRYGYISDGSGVVVFDRKTYAKMTTVSVGGGADGIIFEPVTKTIWSLNRGQRGGTATAIDENTQKLVATVPSAGRLEATAVDGKGNVWTNLGGDLVQIDAKARKIVNTFKTGCEDSSGLAADGEGNRIFQACEGKKMYVVDATSGKVLGTATIGDRPDSADWSAKYHLAFASTGDGLLSVVDAGKTGYPTLEQVKTMSGARTMTYDPATDRIYTVSAEPNPAAASQQQGPPQGGGQGQGGPGGQQGGPGGPGQGGGPGGGPSGPSRYLANTLTVIVLGR